MIRRLLSFPRFEDEDRTREARILYFVLLVLLVVAVVATIISPFAAEDPRPNVILGAALVPLLISAMAIVKGGQVRAAAVVVSVTMWIIVTISSFVRGTIEGPAVMNYVSVITMTALVWDGKAALALAACTLVSTAALFLMQTRGLVPPGVVPGLRIYWLNFSATIVFNGGLIYVATRSLSGSLRRTRQSEKALSQSVQELKDMQSKLLQAQKMEAVGRLAGGVAHDFNNHLTAIRGYAEMAAGSPDLAEETQEDLLEVKKSVDRAARLTRQLLAFSRKQLLQPQVIDLNALISELERMLRRLIGEDIDIALRLGRDLQFTRSDPGQIETVIINLALNARDAMPDGGQLIIETGDAQLDKQYMEDHNESSPGPYVMVAVTDTGVGMDAETRDRIFEPFFTTKDAGHGTGLGLSTVYGIVKQSSGHIWVYSEPGEGTTFKVYLPAHIGQPDQTGAAPREQQVRGGDETVLLVEDDPAVLDLVARTLEARGYKVLGAPRADLALSAARLHGAEIDLLLTDVVLPGGKSGRELADEMTGSRQGLRILYMSGYTPGAISHHGVLEPGVRYLQKPFSPDTLCRTVRQVLDED